jgi:hypothetical protein
MNIELQSMAIEMPQCAAHPNRAPFRGVLTLVDTPSDRAPSGANGHRVLLTRSACERALPSLLGMGLDYAPLLDAHDQQRKIGIITEANIVENRLPGVGSRLSGATADGRLPMATRIEISGFLYARDFPGVVRTLRSAQNDPTLRPTTPASAKSALAGDPGHRPEGRATQERQQSGKHTNFLYGMSYEVTDARIDDTRAPVWIVTDFTFTGAAVLRRDKAAYRETWFELL